MRRHAELVADGDADGAAADVEPKDTRTAAAA